MPCHDDRDTREYLVAEIESGGHRRYMLRPDQTPTATDKSRRVAGRLLVWLVDQLNPDQMAAVEKVEAPDHVGVLCEAIKSLGEPALLAICRWRFDEPPARELAGWWETHKRNDAARQTPA